MLSKFDPHPHEVHWSRRWKIGFCSQKSLPSCHFPSASPVGRVMPAPLNVIGSCDVTAAPVSDGQLPALHQHLDKYYTSQIPLGLRGAAGHSPNHFSHSLPPQFIAAVSFQLPRPNAVDSSLTLLFCSHLTSRDASSSSPSSKYIHHLSRLSSFNAPPWVQPSTSPTWITPVAT